MGQFTVSRSNLNHISDPQLRAKLEDRRVELLVEHDIIAIFYQGDSAVAERRYPDNNMNYVVDAAENWCSGIMDAKMFTLEERLKAG